MTDVPHPHARRWHKGRRYYAAELAQDLFGHWELSLAWGRIGTRLGGTQRRPADKA